MYKVLLSACGNIDHNENPNDSIVNKRNVPSKEVQAATLDGCKTAVLEYIDYYDLGAGNWTGGQTYKNDEYIGRFSYNGRFWGADTDYGKGQT